MVQYDAIARLRQMPVAALPERGGQVNQGIEIRDADVFAVTDKGNEELKSGSTGLARMRQHPQLKSIPVIMLTGHARREDVMRGLAGGADGYITKPFDRDVLLIGIRAVLGLG
jgi:DNA-binding response OmpR family regulator